MWTTVLLISLIWIPSTAAVDCKDVLDHCFKQGGPWTRCYEDKITNCIQRAPRIPVPGFHYMMVDPLQKFDERLASEHRVQLPSSALQMSTTMTPETLVVLHVIDSSFFEQPRKTRISITPPLAVLGGKVLAVKAGTERLTNLSEPIILTFRNNQQMQNGSCVFWKESEETSRRGHWSSDGCTTQENVDEYVCSCDHLSFFAVLVNPMLSVTKKDAVRLSYITYVGSALSIFFSVISLIIYICLQRRRQEKAIGVHMQLTGALLCLHLSFLLGSLWVQWANQPEGWVCSSLGLFLHWSLLAAISWMALEGFHLYLLLIRVFNIYIRRYLLKLSLVGWGLPTLTAAICCSLGVYGKYDLPLKDASGHNSTASLCWMSSQFPQSLLVNYITVVAFPCLVAMSNSCMLGLVVFKMWGLRRGGMAWKHESKDRTSRLWKDCVTVVGLSFVLGLPWALASTTYVSTLGIYVFTILNSLQGVFVFLWSMALTCKPRCDNNSSARDPSSQKMMTTSFNN